MEFMQDQYTGDIGDFIKYTLLRELGAGRRLGFAWYLYPDGGSGDGKHTEYLEDSEPWRKLNPDVFDAMKKIVNEKDRSVSAIEAAGLFPDAVFAGERLDTELRGNHRREWRAEWFSRTLKKLCGCEIVFADPDNGLCEDAGFRPGRKTDWKRLPVCEARQLAEGRTAVLYHHNTRRGHQEEIKYWMARIPKCRAAVYWRRWSNRTFFIVNPDSDVTDRLRRFEKKLRDFERSCPRWRTLSKVIWR